MHARLSYIFPATLALFLAACGSGDPSVSDENSFGERSSFSTTPACEKTRDLEDNQLRVSVQVPDNGPDAEAGLGLVNTTNTSLTITGPTGSSKSVDFQREVEGDTFRLTFADGIPQDFETVIEAGVTGESTRYRAPLATNCGHVYINPLSDLLVSDVVAELVSDYDSVNEIDNCNAACRYDLIWKPAADATQSFEIDVSGGTGALQDRKDFMAYLAQLRSLLKESAASIGELESESNELEFSYNAIQYGISLNKAGNEVFWATHTPARGESSTDAGTSYTYPGYSITSTPFALSGLISNGSIDIPRVRSTFNGRDIDEAFTSYSTRSQSLYQDNQNMLYSLRPILQTVSDAGTRLVGWAPNPHIHKANANRANDDEAPESLLSSYFHAARGWELNGSEGDGYERDDILEEQAIANIELNLSEWENGDEFTSNAEYQFAGFELKPGQSGSIQIARASLGTWDLANGTETNQTSSDWSLNDTSSPYKDFQLDSVIPERSPNENSGQFKGDLFINYDNYPIDDNSTTGSVPNAAVSSDKRWIAASARPVDPASAEGGSLLRIAYKQQSGDKLPQSGAPTYKVQGFSIDSNGLTQHENACFKLDNSVNDTAAYSFTGHRTTYNTSSIDSFSIAKRAEESGSDCSLTENSDGSFTIEDCEPDSRQFEGFVADGGNTLVMITKSNESVGFLLGFRDDSAEGCPN